MKRNKLWALLGMALVSAAGFMLGARTDFGRDVSASPPADLPPVLQADIDALADGVVSDQEYRAAFDRWVGCVEASGAKVAGPISRDRFGHFSVPMEGPADVAPGEANAVAQGLLRARTDCHVRHLSAIQLQWNQAHRPSSDEDIEAREYLAQCLRDSGVTLAATPTQAELQSVVRTAWEKEFGGPSPTIDCVLETQRELNWPGFIVS